MEYNIILHNKCYHKACSPFFHFSEWEIIGGPIGGSCTGNTASIEQCAQPVIPACVDRIIYCNPPPIVPTGVVVNALFIQVPGWNNVPNTK